MHTSLEDRDKILHGCGDHNVLSLDKKFHSTLAAKDACDHSLWGCYDLCNEATKLRPMGGVSWVKAEISRMFTNFWPNCRSEIYVSSLTQSVLSIVAKLCG